MGTLPLLAFFVLVQGPSLRVRGTVLDSKGTPQVGAEVILTSPGLPFVYEAEVLRTRTDKRGRFHQRLDPGRVYSAWSHFKDAKGMNHLSPIQGDVRPGRILILRESPPQASKSLRLKNLAAWGKPGALELVWNIDGRGGLKVAEPIDARNLVRVPDFMPMRRFGLGFELRTRSGLLLFQGQVWAGKEKTTSLSFTLPKPVVFPILVQEGGSKKPIPGAQVSYRCGYDPELSQVETDEQGRAFLKVPEFRKMGSPNLHVFVSKKGFAGSNAFLGGSSRSIQGKWVAADPKKPLKEVVFSLGKDLPITGEVRGLDGHPLAGAVIRWSTTLYKRKEGGSTWGENGRTHWIQVSSNGRFQLPSVPPNLIRMELSLYLRPASWNRLLGGKAAYPLPEGALMKKTWRPGRKNDRHIIFDFAQYRILPFRVSGPDGAPVPFPELHWRKWNDLRLSATGDRRGKGFLLVPPGKACFYGMAPNHGYFIDESAQAPGGKDFVAPMRTLTMEKPETFLEGLVMDGDGKPLPGVSISPRGWSISGGNPRIYAAREINFEFLQGKTDEKGRFRLPYIEDPHLRINLDFSNQKFRRKIQVTSAREDLRIELK